MTLASDLRTGMSIKLNGELYKIILAEFKVGTAKLPSSMHLRLRNLGTGGMTESRLHPEARVESVSLEAVTMEFSYADGDTLFFMHPKTFDQVAIPKRMLGAYEKFLDSGSKLKIEFLGEEPIDAVVPQRVEVRIAATGAPLHGDVDSAPKSATLDNGMEIPVPQFIKTGDRIVVDVESGKYVERVR
jgi:elongation factor P